MIYVHSSIYNKSQYHLIKQPSYTTSYMFCIIIIYEEIAKQLFIFKGTSYMNLTCLKCIIINNYQAESSAVAALTGHITLILLQRKIFVSGFA